ncbi:MAG: rane protein [Actinoallomurus sp.]|nr:rane protein [Actinoallomurus sp.]
MLVLIGVLLVVAGFALRLNPLVVVTVAGIVTGLLGKLSPLAILNAFGNGFAGSRSVTLFIIVLPVIGLIERFGLQEQGRRLIARLSALTTGRLLVLYQLIRQVSSALGLASINGPAALVRPLVYPMAEGAAERRFGPALPEAMREKIKGFSASADTVGQFFGEDIFVAIGSILLITGFVDTAYGLKLDALHVALWAIPTAICAFAIHGARLFLLDRQLTSMALAAGLTKNDKDAAEAGR